MKALKSLGNTYQDKTDNDESNSQTKESTKEEPSKMIGKKTKRIPDKIPKINNEFCSICRLGGNLILCDDCVRSFHIECLKINEEDIPEGNWFCPICTLKKDKKDKSATTEYSSQEVDEKQRKRLIKNEKRRLWRMKKKEEQEAIKNKIDSINNINGINPNNFVGNKHDLIDTILTSNGNVMQMQSINGKSYLGVINRMSKLPLNNSKICLNITYTQLLEKEQKQNKSLSLPLLFPIPNNILKNFYEKSNNLYEILNKRKITKYILENYNQENRNNSNINNNNNNSNKNNNNQKEKEKEKDKDEDINAIYEKYKDLISLNQDIINNECGDTSEEISKILKLPNSIKALNNIISENKDILRYNTILRDYWNVILEKKSSTSITNKHVVKYPINSKELYSFPDYHGIDEKYFKKTEGEIFPYFNGKIFTRIINIYDFILTFSPKLYIDKFSVEELYAALYYSENYKKGEIFLLSSIHISLIFLLICELSEIPLLDLYNKREIELIMLKVITEHKKDDIKKVFSFLYYSWPELIRLFLISNTFNKSCIVDSTLLEKVFSIHDIISYNTDLNFEEKIIVLEKIIFICCETNFVRNTIKDDQDRKNEMKKKEREMDEKLREIESKKKEMERQNQFTQPELRIEEINKKLKNLQSKKNSEYKKNKSKLEAEREKFKTLITEMNSINNQRDEIIFKIANFRDEAGGGANFNKSYLGTDGRSYKYYYFNWMENLIFIRVHLKNKDKDKDNDCDKNKDKDKDINNKYEWRIINNKDILNNDLIDKLSDKGIEESDLKNKLTKIYKKILQNKTETKIFCDTLEDVFEEYSLKYENNKNPLKSDKTYNFPFIASVGNLYQSVSEQIKKIEANITKYLTLDNRQWESVANRTKIKEWIPKIKDVSQFVNILLFFNERIKNPYKTESAGGANNNNGNNNNPPVSKKINKKVVDDDTIITTDTKKEKDIFDENGNLLPYFVNEKLTYANRIRLWTKENESYNVEKIYLAYLRNVKTFPQLYICLTLFDIAVNELNKRKEYYKKKEKAPEVLINEPKEEEKKKEEVVSVENYNGDKRRTILKKKKLIDYNVECMFCQEFGDFLCCDECPNVAHLSCAKLKSRPDVWICPNCQSRKK